VLRTVFDPKQKKNERQLKKMSGGMGKKETMASLTEAKKHRLASGPTYTTEGGGHR